jgi:hypothetical protein
MRTIDFALWSFAVLVRCGAAVGLVLVGLAGEAVLLGFPPVEAVLTGDARWLGLMLLTVPLWAFWGLRMGPRAWRACIETRAFIQRGPGW